MKLSVATTTKVCFGQLHEPYSISRLLYACLHALKGSFKGTHPDWSGAQVWQLTGNTGNLSTAAFTGTSTCILFRLKIKSLLGTHHWSVAGKEVETGKGL